MYCQKCGIQMDGSAQFCKACTPPRRQNSLALLGLVLAFAGPAAGLVVSIIARKQCIQRGEDGETLAKAGIILSIVFIALLLSLIPIVFVAAWQKNSPDASFFDFIRNMPLY